MTASWHNGWHPSPVKREAAALRAMKVQLCINRTDAAAECDHGCLPHDRRKPDECRCWTFDAAASLAMGAR